MRAFDLAWRPFRRHSYPFELTFERLLPLVFAALFLGEPGTLLFEPARVVALVRYPLAAVEFEYPAGDVVEEITVVRHRDDRALVFLQMLLQPADGLGVQVIRRLIEKQDVRLLQQQAAQSNAALFAAGQAC